MQFKALKVLLLSTLICSASFTSHAQMVVDRSILTRGTPKVISRTTPQQSHSAVFSGPYKLLSYTMQEPGVRIYSKNVLTPVTFTTPVLLPEDAPITNVAWKYALKQHPEGLEVLLCLQNQTSCINITRNEIGSTPAFNDQHAGVTFMIQYQIKGQGLLGPAIIGGANQLVVTYATTVSETETID
jgi:hypothetical protein